MKRSLVYVLASLAFIASEADGQTARLIGTADFAHPTVVSLLERAGCNPLWLSKAAKDSGISASAVNSLPPGRRVVLREPNCNSTPPSDVAKASQKMMLQRPSVRRVSLPPPPAPLTVNLTQKVAELEAEVTSLKSRNTVLETANNTLASENTTLKSEKSALETANQTLTAAATLDDSERWRLTWQNFGLGTLFAIVALGLIWLLGSRRNSSRQEQKIELKDRTGARPGRS